MEHGEPAHRGHPVQHGAALDEAQELRQSGQAHQREGRERQRPLARPEPPEAARQREVRHLDGHDEREEEVRVEDPGGRQHVHGAPGQPPARERPEIAEERQHRAEHRQRVRSRLLRVPEQGRADRGGGDREQRRVPLSPHGEAERIGEGDGGDTQHDRGQAEAEWPRPEERRRELDDQVVEGRLPLDQHRAVDEVAPSPLGHDPPRAVLVGPQAGAPEAIRPEHGPDSDESGHRPRRAPGRRVRSGVARRVGHEPAPIIRHDAAARQLCPLGRVPRGQLATTRARGRLRLSGPVGLG